MPLEDRFWPKVNKTETCWLWTAAKQTRSGYGVFCITRTENALAHRMSYMLARGPIPEGMQVDHLCRVRGCVRPDHLELVTPGENTKRGYASRRVEKHEPLVRTLDDDVLLWIASLEHRAAAEEIGLYADHPSFMSAVEAEVARRHLSPPEISA